MAEIVVTLNVEQEKILSKIAARTNRTPKILLENYLHGFIESLREEALRPEVENEFFKLSFTDKMRAMNYVQGKV